MAWEWGSLETLTNEGFQRETTRRMRNLTQYLRVQFKAQSTWVAWTGTADRSTENADASFTVSNPPTQAEVQAIATALVETRQAMKALLDDLIAKGILGS